MSDGKTKRLFLGLDKIPKRALIFNNFEKNNFSTYYGCNALAFYKLLTFYYNLLGPENSFSEILTKLFNKTKQIESIRNSLFFYNKKFSISDKFSYSNFFFNRGLPPSFSLSLEFSKN